MTKEDEIKQFLRHIGDDFVEGDMSIDTSPECGEPSDEEGGCPDHNDCGICRFEYMKKKGWLKEEL